MILAVVRASVRPCGVARLAAAAVLAVFSATAGAALTSAAAAAGSVPPAATAAATGQANGPDSALRNRLEGTGPLSVIGEPLHTDLLRRFYAAHDWLPVWPSRPRQAEALLRAVMAAGRQGLDPSLFHAALLRNPDSLSPVDRELVLSDAVLGYAAALARGALPIADREGAEYLAPEPVDVAAVVDRALASRDPASVIVALAPHAPAYRTLRRALAAYDATARDDPVAAARRRALEVNLERLRWLPRPLPADRVWVNTAAAQLVLYHDNRPIFTTRVIVGAAKRQTPEFATAIDSVLFNPPWNIPPSIAATEILPKLSENPDYLAEHYMVWRRPGALQQAAGPHSALGRLKFEMADRYDVYLHDTPERFLFARRDRRRSHGCVRVQAPRVLASLLLDEPLAAIDEEIARGTTHRRYLKTPMPVFIVYQTVVAEPDGRIDFFPDVYDRDWAIWRRLHPAEPTPIAEHEPASQRRG